MRYSVDSAVRHNDYHYSDVSPNWWRLLYSILVWQLQHGSLSHCAIRQKWNTDLDTPLWQLLLLFTVIRRSQQCEIRNAVYYIVPDRNFIASPLLVWLDYDVVQAYRCFPCCSYFIHTFITSLLLQFYRDKPFSIVLGEKKWMEFNTNWHSCLFNIHLLKICLKPWH